LMKAGNIEFLARSLAAARNVLAVLESESLKRLVEAMPPNALARLDADRRRCAAIAARAELAAQEALEQAAIEDGELQRVHELVRLAPS